MTRTQTIKNKADQAPAAALPQDTSAALRLLTRLTQKLINIAEMETQALVRNDHLQFAYIQPDKEKTAASYAQAAQEFSTRREDFRKADKGLLHKLDTLQTTLRQKSNDNNDVIDQLKKRARANTQNTLFSVQEMGQRITLPQDNTPETKGETA